MVQQAGIQHTKGTGGGQKKKAGKKGKGPEIVFDELARAEYLTGFRKRKQDRKEAGREHLAKKAKEELLAQRRETRKARREQAAENVRNERKAFGLEGQGESDLDDHDDQEQSDTEVVQQAEDYDSDQHHTHVTVETFDPEEAAFAQATSTPARRTEAGEPVKDGTAAKTKGASSTKVEALPPSSRRVNKAKANASLTSLSLPHVGPEKDCSTDPRSCSLSLDTGKGKEANHPHKEENGSSQQQQEKRLVVSGFTTAFTQAELIQRFSAFGTVVALDGFGKHDAVGNLRPFTYLTLRATESQTRRCMNLLSGSMWKGAKLRIGEAKPDFEQRWAQEQQKEAEKRTLQEREQRAKLKRKRLPPGMALESPHLSEPITQHHLDQGFAWGWKISPQGYLVRPLRVRPDHPLPKPQALPSTVDLGTQRQKPRRLNSRPPTKAHRITIDPTRYGAVHLSSQHFPDAAGATNHEAVDVESLGPGEWQCQEIDPNDDDDMYSKADHRLVRWQYVGTNDLVMHEEFAKLPVRIVTAASEPQPQADTGNYQDEAFMDDFDRYSAAPSDDLFSDFPNKISNVQNGARNEVDDLFSDFPVTTKAIATPRQSQSDETSDLFSDFPTTTVPHAVTSIDPLPADQGQTSGTFVPGLDPEEYNDPAYFSDGYDEGLAASTVPFIDDEGERRSTLALIAQMFGTSASKDPVTQQEPDTSESSDSSVDASEGEQPALTKDLQSADSSADSVSADSVSSRESGPQSIQAQDNIESVVSNEDEGKTAAPDSVDDESTSSEDETSGSKGGNTSSEDESSSSGSEGKEDKPTMQQGVEEEVAPASASSDASTRPKTLTPPAAAVATVDPVPADIAAPETGAKPSRRAAFLFDAASAHNHKDKDSTTSQNAPGVDSRLIPRFDPGPRSAAASDSTSAPISTNGTAPQSQSAAAASANTVAFSSLKAMFQPQQSSSQATTGFSFSLGPEHAQAEHNSKDRDAPKGFSIMDALGLELELELEHQDQDQEAQEEQFVAQPSMSSVHMHPSRAAILNPNAHITAQTSASASTAAPTSGSFFLTAPVTGASHFPTPKSDQEILQNWHKYQLSLTSQIKKRHREALKKRKRRVGPDITRHHAQEQQHQQQR